MTTLARRILLVLAVAATIGALAGASATAQTSSRGGLLAVAADYVGLTRDGLRAELRRRSLAQVAAAQGRTRDGLVQRLVSAAEERLNARPLSDERKQQIRARLPQRIERLVDKVWTRNGLRARVAKRGLLAAAADYLGLEREGLRERLRAGQSLADVAAAQGRSVDGLKRAMLDSVRARLAERPALSAERRHRLLARAERLIERMIARKRS
jgi:hypothetical protein